MFILSFDIGIKNLAYCYSEDDRIIKWNVIDIQGPTVTDTCEICVRSLDAIFKDDIIDQVLIENQPVQKNPTMKTIQIVVYTYFIYRKLLGNGTVRNVSFIAANRKNKYTTKFDINIECKTKYQENKKRAIACTKFIVESSYWEEHFNKHKKKDDLADSYLQTLAFINYEPVLPKPPSPLLLLEEDTNSSTSST